MRRKATKRLTKRMVEEAELGCTWDLEVPGFGVRVLPSGTRQYVLKVGRGRRGASQWITIGTHGSEAPAHPTTGAPQQWTVELARERARLMRGQAIAGADPSAAKRAARAMPTLREFARRYLDDYARPHKSPESFEKDAEKLERPGPDGAMRQGVIVRKLGARALDKIGPVDVTRFHLSLGSTPVKANRCLALLSHMFTMARTWLVLPPGHVNPCQDVKRFPERKQNRYLSEAELATLGDLLASAEDAAADGRKNSTRPVDTIRGNGRRYTQEDVCVLHTSVIAAVRLLIFTGARLSEILRLRWEQVNLQTGVLLGVQTKTGPRDILLSGPAAAVLDALPRRGGWVLPRRLDAKKHLTRSGLELAWRRIRRRAGLPDVRVHHLRHSFASVAASGGGTLPIIGALLGHTRPETTARYAHLFTDPLRRATDEAGKVLDAAMRRRQ